MPLKEGWNLRDREENESSCEYLTTDAWRKPTLDIHCQAFEFWNNIATDNVRILSEKKWNFADWIDVT